MHTKKLQVEFEGQTDVSDCVSDVSLHNSAMPDSVDDVGNKLFSTSKLRH
jgi:hypothetical protein